MKRFRKDPSAVLDYQIDWTRWLKGDVVSSSGWSVSGSGLTVDSSTFTDSTSTAFLSGGTDGEVYTVTCRISTTAGRTNDQSFTLKIAQQ